MMNLEKYRKAVAKNQKKEPWIRDCLFAFVSGGIMGLIGQGLMDLYEQGLHLTTAEAAALMAMTVVFLTSLLTLFGIYKHLGKICGAGLFLPTTGFANSITSSSMEGRDEGFVVGIGGQMFALAGSVITYGIVSSAALLIVRFFLMLWGVEL